MPDNNAPIDVADLIDIFVTGLSAGGELDAAVVRAVQQLDQQGRLTTDVILGELHTLSTQKEALLESVAEGVREPLMQDLFTPQPPDLFGQNESVRWYLAESADELDAGEATKEEEAARRLETYAHDTVDYSNPANRDEGVHYSDLFEHYLPLQDKPRRLLQDWLPEFFFKTSAGAWRSPLTEEERGQKEALRAGGALRRIKRFVRSLEEGVPPAAHDRPARLLDAAEWVRQCRRAGLYAFGRALYEKGGFDFGLLPEEAQVEVEDNYQVCMRRS